MTIEHAAISYDEAMKAYDAALREAARKSLKPDTPEHMAFIAPHRAAYEQAMAALHLPMAAAKPRRRRAKQELL